MHSSDTALDFEQRVVARFQRFAGTNNSRNVLGIARREIERFFNEQDCLFGKVLFVAHESEERITADSMFAFAPRRFSRVRRCMSPAVVQGKSFCPLSGH
jgi:hypothetical protein